MPLGTSVILDGGDRFPFCIAGFVYVVVFVGLVLNA